MAATYGRPVTDQDVIDAANVFISNLLDDPPENAIYDYNPGMRCYDVSFGVLSSGTEGWSVFVERALPEDDGLRMNICEYLEGKFGIGVNVVLEWR